MSAVLNKGKDEEPKLKEKLKPVCVYVGKSKYPQALYLRTKRFSMNDGNTWFADVVEITKKSCKNKSKTGKTFSHTVFMGDLASFIDGLQEIQKEYERQMKEQMACMFRG